MCLEARCMFLRYMREPVCSGGVLFDLKAYPVLKFPYDFLKAFLRPGVEEIQSNKLAFCNTIYLPQLNER